jgi:hypothetical protein
MTGSRLAAPEKISMRRVTMEVSRPWVGVDWKALLDHGDG